MTSAVVVGAGMAGLLAARVLGETFDRVTLVDRDHLGGGPVPRRGVPQGRHPHALLTGGLRALQQLFPGLTDDLVRHGALRCDLLADSRLHVEGRLVRQAHGGLPAVGVSRPLLEDRVRAAVVGRPGVAVIAPAVLLDLEEDEGRVTGVRVRRQDRGAPEDAVLPADLVVDATGRGSRTPVWLQEHGMPAPAESAIEVGIHYTSWVLARRPDDLGGALFLLTTPTARNPRFGGAMAVEGGRWQVGCAGYQGDTAPLDQAGLEQFAATLPAPDLGGLVSGREPLEAPRVHRFRSSVRRHYEALPAFPAGLLVVGDALSSFNPIYGQGMTVAAMEALALRTALAEDRGDLARRFFRAAARLVDVAWDLAAMSDLSLPVVPGRRSARTRTVNAYVNRIRRASTTDVRVARTFMSVANLMDPPSALIRPGMLARVAAAGAGRQSIR